MTQLYWNSRTRAGIALVTLAIVVSAVGGYVAAQTPTTFITGCLTAKGTLYNVALGAAPVDVCKPGDRQISWSDNADITGVFGSKGLGGGADSGEVTLVIAPSYRLPQDCRSGQVAKWRDMPEPWQCADDSDTTYTAGAGLSLTGTTFSVATGGITESNLADDSVTASKISPTGSTAAQVLTSSGAAVGWQSLPSSGALSQYRSYATTTVDSAGGVGGYTSITVGADALGLVSYYATTGDLKVAHCGDGACTSAAISTLDSVGSPGGPFSSNSSITIGGDGLGIVSYLDITNGDLKVAHCNNTACSSATKTTLDSTGFVGAYSSISIGADGLALISYFDNTNRDLKAAHCSNTVCTSATTATLDSTGDVGGFTSITIGADALGLISYHGFTSGDLKVAHCNNISCTSATTTTLDTIPIAECVPGSCRGVVGQHTSIAIAADGRALISYQDSVTGVLKVAHCDDAICTSAKPTTLDDAGNVGFFTSMTIGGDGLGLISYFDETNFDLKVAHCSDTACIAATTTTLDGVGNVGWFTSITIAADGLALIGYFDISNGHLKVAHCSNARCVPFHRVR